MKFQVAKSDLETAISTVGGAMNAADGDISSHLLFRMKPGPVDKVEMLAASNRIYANCVIQKAVVTDAGSSFTIEGWRLKGWIGMVGDVPLDFETTTDAEVIVKGGKYTQRFRSLDPSHFHFMDKTLAGAEFKGRIKAKRLSHALRIAKSFASTDDTTKPDVVVVDIQDGQLVATDKSSVVVFFTLNDLPKCTMRVHIKDVSGMASFLDQVDGDVEVLDATRVVFIRRLSDNAVYGETRYMVNFPKLTPPATVDQRTWSVKASELRRAAQHGHFGARKDDKRLFVHPPDSEGRIKVSMKTDTNVGVFTPVYIECTEVKNDPKASDIPSDGFPVSYQHVLAILDAFPNDDNLDLGVNFDPVKNRMYIRVAKKVFVDDKDGSCDTYLFVLAGMVW